MPTSGRTWPRASRRSGRSRHGDLTRDAAISDMARRVAAEAPDRFALIGFSMGGYVAREVARRVPDRVRALVLIATSARADTPAPGGAARPTAVAHVRQHGFTGLSRGRDPPIRASGAGTGDVALIARIRRMGDRLGGPVFLRQAGQARAADRDRLGAIAMLDSRCGGGPGCPARASTRRSELAGRHPRRDPGGDRAGRAHAAPGSPRALWPTRSCRGSRLRPPEPRRSGRSGRLRNPGDSSSGPCGAAAAR